MPEYFLVTHVMSVQNKQYLPSRLFLLIVYNIRSSHHRDRAEAFTWSPTVISALSCYRCNCRLTSQINLQPLNQIIFTGCLSSCLRFVWGFLIVDSSRVGGMIAVPFWRGTDLWVCYCTIFHAEGSLTRWKSKEQIRLADAVPCNTVCP